MTLVVATALAAATAPGVVAPFTISVTG
jgi:hypothetical protein